MDEEVKEEVKEEEKESPYTGSLFSYTPGIRSLRNVFAVLNP
jgi:hypothetical protein